MDTISTVQPRIHYPETDGKPMGESDVHIDVLIYLREALRDHFRDDPMIYVAGSMLLYYQEGSPAARAFLRAHPSLPSRGLRGQHIRSAEITEPPEAMQQVSPSGDIIRRFVSFREEVFLGKLLSERL